MFYSHTFLARKGPLGTVWCAAHLQHKLKKSHYTSTNIPSTVERIMYPEVPIALRMSGHLLLGVVRIYSKQVDYLYQDCNDVLIGLSKAFCSVNINLPEDATQAPFQSVTLPETFELDALELDDDFSLGRSEDKHLKLQEDITLEDQIPTGTDPYIVITFDEDMGRSSPVPQDASKSGAGTKPMDDDFLEGTTAILGDPSPNKLGEFNERTVEDETTEDVPELETLRDAVHIESPPIWPDLRNDTSPPDMVLLEQIMKDNEDRSPFLKEVLSSGGPSTSVHQPDEPKSLPLEQPSESLDVHFSLGHATPKIVLQPSPPVEQPRAKQRKRKRQFYDESTVLTNKFMKKALEDSHDLRRKKGDCPASYLDIWKLKNRLKKDLIFVEPLITGFSTDLHGLYQREVISSKPHLIISEEVCSEPERMQTSYNRGDNEIEIEHLRDFEGPTDGNMLFDVLPSSNAFASSPTMSMPSPIRRDVATLSTMGFGSDTDRLETTVGTDIPPSSSRLFGSGFDTTASPVDKALGVKNSVLSDIPETANSAGELSFLELDDCSPAGSLGTPESGQLTGKDKETQDFDKLSARTRAVAQYLNRQLSVTPSSEGRNLNLNSILKGKSQKICARMFTEILVLKNCDLIYVNQEVAYGDITLKATSKFSKEQFSG